MHTLRRLLVLVIAGSVLTAVGLANGEPTVTYAGTIRSIANGVMVVEDVGPWRGTQQETEITAREIILDPTATFVVARRVKDGRTAFPGDYVEIPAQRSELKPGTFVAVQCQPTRDGCQLVKATMVPPQPPE
jgi:hypothetical protein